MEWLKYFILVDMDIIWVEYLINKLMFDFELKLFDKDCFLIYFILFIVWFW